jgi:hypothetical protein
MGVSAGALGTGMAAVLVGGFVMLAGVGMFLSGPLVTAHYHNSNGVLGIGGSQSASSSVNLLPVLGLVVVLVGAAILLAGLRGTMHTFERGKERDEGTRHHLTVERR